MARNRIRCYKDVVIHHPDWTIEDFEKEEEIDLNELLSEMKKTDEELQQTQTEFMSLLKELISPDEKIMSSLNNLIEKMEDR